MAEKKTDVSKFMSMLKKNATDFNTKKEIPVFSWESPGVNYLFGSKGGMRGGYTTMLYGPPKSGKSLLAYAAAGALHKRDPEAHVLHFDTEIRQNADTWAKSFGIDMDRFHSYPTNKANEIFDFIADEVEAALQGGMPIKMIIIDSVAGIMFPKESNRDKSTDMVIGDAAAYLGPAMKMVLSTIRKYDIALILCQHVRQNMDPNMAKYRPYIVPGGVALKHFVEYWVLVTKIENKDSKTFDSVKKDGSGNAIQTGHKIRVKMEENSDGPQSRAIEIDLSYAKGIINQHYEIAELAKNMGAVERPNNTAYVVGDKKYMGFDNFAAAIKADDELREHLLEAIKRSDIDADGVSDTPTEG